MHSGPPATITHRKLRLPLPGRQAKPAHTKAQSLKPPRFEGREGREIPEKGPSKAEIRFSDLDFPIAVVAHSPRIG